VIDSAVVIEIQPVPRSAVGGVKLSFGSPFRRTSLTVRVHSALKGTVQTWVSSKSFNPSPLPS